MIRFLLLMIAVTIASTTHAQTDTPPQDPRITAYQTHRAEHSEAMKVEQQAFDDAVKNLAAEVERTQTEVESEAIEISRLQGELTETNLAMTLANGAYYAMVNAIFPMLTVLGAANVLGVTEAGDVATWATVFFVITVVNMFLVLVFREREIFQKHKRFFLWLLVLVLLIVSVPAMAQQQSAQDEVTSKLKLVNEILGQSDHQRYIAILEAKLPGTISVPTLESGDPLLFVFPSVSTMSAEYYFSLAALYTHEKMLGKAVDAVIAISAPTITFKSGNRDQIVINSVKFLLKQERTQAASDMLEIRLTQLSDVALILDLSTFLSSQGMSTSADSARSQAIKQAKTVTDLLQLAQFFEDSSEYERASSALKRAANSTKSRDGLLAVLKLAARLNRDEIVNELINSRLPTVAARFEDRIPVLDVLIELGQREEATQLITNAVAEITPSNRNRVATLTSIIEESLNRGFTEQALNATMRLASYLGKNAYQYQISLSPNMESSRGLELPENKVTLPLFWGLLNEESGFKDTAEGNYIRAVLSTLERVANSYGYKLPESLTDFQLLGRIWEEGKQGELLQDLDAVFVRLEQHQLSLLKSKNQAFLTDLRLQKTGLESKQTGSQDTKATLANKIKQRKLELLKRLFMIAGAGLFIVLVIGVASWKAVVFARRKISQKTYGGATKFVEVICWIQVLSIINIVIGAFVVVLSQFFMLFHRNAENTSHKTT